MTFHLSFLWILCLVLSFYSHAMKTYLILTILMLIHELGHILMAKLLKYEVLKIQVYPFGLCASIPESNHGKSWHEIIIICSGIGLHFVYPCLFQLAYRLDLISIGYLNTLNELNHAILCFNLLPIYPLDGAKLLDACLHWIFPYQIARNITLLISAIIFLMMLTRVRINMLLILGFISVQYIQTILNHTEDLLAFYYYRYQHPLPLRNQSKKYLYRNHAVKLKNKQSLDEKIWLRQLFGKRNDK